MYRIPGAYSRKTTTPAPAVPQVQPTRDLPPSSPHQPEDGHPTGPAGAREDLQAALGLMVDHPANGKIRHAVDELDQAIRDIPDTVFDRPAGGQPPPGTSTSTT